MPSLIYLVRHGESEPSGAGSDANRALTAAGRDKLSASVKSLKGELSVKKILSSPFARAKQTAEIIAAALGVPVEVDEKLASGQLDGVELLTHAIGQPEGTLLVGHNPEIAGALQCAGGKTPSVPPGMFAAISVDGKSASVKWAKT